MKRLLVVVLILLLGCDDEFGYPHKYPVVVTEVATFSKGKSSYGTDMAFKGTIVFLGNDYEVVRYGFVYSIYSENPELGGERTFISEADNNELAEGTYELQASIGRTIGLCYYRAFVQTNEVVAYGNIIKTPLINGP